MRKCNECGAEQPDEKLAYDKEKDFYLCEFCFCNYYIQKMKFLFKVPGANYANVYQSAQAMFMLQKSRNPVPTQPQDTPKTDTEGTQPPA
jgi:hypothetical protein